VAFLLLFLSSCGAEQHGYKASCGAEQHGYKVSCGAEQHGYKASCGAEQNGYKLLTDANFVRDEAPITANMVKVQITD
jgi:hypothetical protein